MFNRLKNSIGYFVDCIRLVAWANSGKPLPPDTIEIELNFLAGYSQYFEVTETPNAIEYQGKIFVVASEDRETYQELSIVPLQWLNSDFEQINRLEHFKEEYMENSTNQNYQAPDIKANSLEAVNGYLRAINRPEIDSLDQFYREVNVMGFSDVGEIVETFNADMDKFLASVETAKKEINSGNILASGSIRTKKPFDLSSYQLSPEDAALFKTLHAHKKTD